ncbi:Hypp7911 [Branchiostoma lanceolatum]|uniref:Hypp7911 protein n=1 Tax=Branchiostoma lanceolatum TaxID=7740 RepID=A0A8J9Z5B1_BRALA|nr:Hypp7911 [Branchiostoma lanceolatum]
MASYISRYLIGSTIGGVLMEEIGFPWASTSMAGVCLLQGCIMVVFYLVKMRGKISRPHITYMQQLCEDAGCSLEELPRAVEDREDWRRRVMFIRDTLTTR